MASSAWLQQGGRRDPGDSRSGPAPAAEEEEEESFCGGLDITSPPSWRDYERRRLDTRSMCVEQDASAAGIFLQDDATSEVLCNIHIITVFVFESKSSVLHTLGNCCDGRGLLGGCSCCKC